MNPSLLVQFGIGLVPMVVAFFSYRQATRANRLTVAASERSAERNAELEQTKVDADAFGRAKEIYEAALGQLERQLERVRSQFAELEDELARERETSTTLRTQIYTLQRQVRELERIVGVLRTQLITAGVTPADPDPEAPAPADCPTD